MHVVTKRYRANIISTWCSTVPSRLKHIRVAGFLLCYPGGGGGAVPAADTGCLGEDSKLEEIFSPVGGSREAGPAWG